MILSLLFYEKKMEKDEHGWTIGGGFKTHILP